MPSERTPTTGTHLLLFRVPKGTLAEEAISTEERRDRLAVVVGGETTQTSLSQLTHSDLIRAIRDGQVLAGDEIHRLHDEFRYRGMKSLYLFERLEALADISPTPASLNSHLERNDLNTRHSTGGFHTFRVTDVEVVQDVEGLVEYSYTYVAPVGIIDPQTEYPKVVDDLRRAFAWLHTTEAWLAVCARDQIAAATITSALCHIGTFQVRTLPIPKSALQDLEPIEHIRRLSLTDPQTGTRRRWTNQDMARDAEAMDEIRHRDTYNERTTSGYNEELPGGVRFAIGYSNTQGRIFFSRDLTVTQMRGWGPRKLSRLVDVVRALRRTSPTDLLSRAAENVLKRFRTPNQTRG